MTSATLIRPASLVDVDVMVALHAMSFEDAWPRHVLAPSLGMPGSFAFLGMIGSVPAGFVLARVHAGEGEVMTLCVGPAERRQGLARGLLDQTLAQASSRKAEAMFLEVAEDNVAALALYFARGFAEVGRRKGYYQRKDRRADALVLRKSLSPA